MANISLKEYLEQVDSKVRDGAFDEVIFHCQQILQRFPKNIGAYRSLSAALLGSGQWEAAEEAFLRVLGVIPDDVLAHYGLGQVYQHLRQPDQAIWHLERAYEQDPTNKQFVRDLRSLYFEHHGLQDVRLQLTTGAMVQQYERNNLHEQAIDTLITVLDDMPDRIDLQLLLARIFQKSGQRYEAADIALDVLEALPDCLESNLMVARMWLQEQRPSEAQRFLSRIETLDPYLAIEMASGQPPDDYLFNLPEADFRAAKRRQITEAQPDWLSAFDDVSEEEAEEISRTVSEVPAVTDITEDVDWLSELSDLDEVDVPAVSGRSTTSTPKKTGMTGLLSALYSEDDTQEEEEALIETPDLGDIMELDMDGSDQDDDVIEIAPDETDFGLGTGGDDDDDDLLSWLDEDEAEEEPATSTSEQPIAGSDSSDPFAWMRRSGVELADEPQAEIFNPNIIEDDGGELQDQSQVDSIAWLRSTGVEVDTGALSKPVFEEAKPQDDADADPMAWMSDSDVELAEPEAPAPPQAAEPASSWLDDDSLLEEMLSMEELTGDDDFLGAPLFDDVGDEDEPELFAGSGEALFDNNDLTDTMIDEDLFASDDDVDMDDASTSDSADILDLLEPPDVDFDDDDMGFEEEASDFFSELGDDDIDADDLLG